VVEKIEGNISGSLTDPRATNPLKRKPYRVVKVLDPSTVVINVGSAEGITKKDRFLIYALDAEELIDPDTKASLGQLEKVRGTATPLHIQEKMTTVRSDRFESDGRVITRTGGTTLMASIMGQTVEHNMTSVVIDFDQVTVGDLVRKLTVS
jgi:hypothetical protein